MGISAAGFGRCLPRALSALACGICDSRLAIDCYCRQNPATGRSIASFLWISLRHLRTSERTVSHRVSRNRLGLRSLYLTLSRTSIDCLMWADWRSLHLQEWAADQGIHLHLRQQVSKPDAFKRLLPRVFQLFRDHPHLLALFNWHSCRRGGATHGYWQNVSLALLAPHGGWNTEEGLKTYAAASFAQRLSVTQRM